MHGRSVKNSTPLIPSLKAGRNARLDVDDGKLHAFKHHISELDAIDLEPVLLVVVMAAHSPLPQLITLTLQDFYRCNGI